MFLFNPNFMIVKVLETFFFLSFLISYLMTILINPGIPTRKYFIANFGPINNKNTNLIKCSKCNIIVPKSFNITHCDDCQVCVMNYDHHCPWTGKCIGKYNLFPFYWFLISLISYIFMCFFTLLMFLINLEENKIQNRRKILKKFI